MPLIKSSGGGGSPSVLVTEDYPSTEPVATSGIGTLVATLEIETSRDMQSVSIFQSGYDSDADTYLNEIHVSNNCGLRFRVYRNGILINQSCFSNLGLGTTMTLSNFNVTDVAPLKGLQTYTFYCVRTFGSSSVGVSKGQISAIAH